MKRVPQLKLNVICLDECHIRYEAVQTLSKGILCCLTLQETFRLTYDGTSATSKYYQTVQWCFKVIESCQSYKVDARCGTDLRIRAMHEANTALLDFFVDNSVIIPSFQNRKALF